MVSLILKQARLLLLVSGRLLASMRWVRPGQPAFKSAFVNRVENGPAGGHQEVEKLCLAPDCSQQRGYPEPMLEHVRQERS